MVSGDERREVIKESLGNNGCFCVRESWVESCIILDVVDEGVVVVVVVVLLEEPKWLGLSR